MRIVHKMALGYILLVFLPVILFGYMIYNQFDRNIRDNYIQGKQELINQAANSLKVRLTQVQSIYTLFQYNAQAVDYLNGLYRTEGDQVYTFLKDVRPIFSFAYSADSAVDSIRLFKTNTRVLAIAGEIEDIASLGNDPRLQERLQQLRVNRGMWLPRPQKDRSSVPTMSYYQKVYNNLYTRELAVLEVTVDDQILAEFLHTVDAANNMDIWIMHGDETIYSSGDGFSDTQMRPIVDRFDSGQANNMNRPDDRLVANMLTLDELQLRFYFISPTDEIIKDVREQMLFFGSVLLLLLVVLSVVYYAIASVLTRRVLKLAKHMRNTDETKLSPYERDNGNDEIGFLTQSYNSLITRIDELLNKVHRAELMKKEADYLVLQAQIKPHFLYNTLESIRMLAEINNDQEVVEATYTFSKLLRYSLSPGGNETSLQEEVENVRHYLDIHKLRMMEKLTYDIRIDADISGVRCPRFILQPLVENSIHHGVSKRRRNGWIKVSIAERDAALIITIADNGPGIPAERLSVINGVLNNTVDREQLHNEDSGLGLYNVSERIKAFFGEGSGFELESREGEGTTCILTLKQ